MQQTQHFLRSNSQVSTLADLSVCQLLYGVPRGLSDAITAPLRDLEPLNRQPPSDPQRRRPRDLVLNSDWSQKINEQLETRNLIGLNG